MKYILRRASLGPGPRIALQREQYDAIVQARLKLRLAADIEEKLDLVLENLVDYERDLLSIAIRDCLFPSTDFGNGMNQLHLAARRAMNLLSSARSYIDQTKHATSRFFGGDAARAEKVTALFRQQYDGHLEYRVAEALRNYVQHLSLPVHILRSSVKWEEQDEAQQRLRYWTVPLLSLDQLVEEGEFKKTVLEELLTARSNAKEKTWELTPTLRRYVECLTIIHQGVRSLLAEELKAAHEVILHAMGLVRAEGGDFECVEGLLVVATDDAGVVTARHNVNELPWGRRAALAQKNESFPNLALRYVSGEHPGDGAQPK